MPYPAGEPFQFCPECALYGSIDSDCWKCDGDGMVEPFDPLEPRYQIDVGEMVQKDPEGKTLTESAHLPVRMQELPPEIDFQSSEEEPWKN